MKILIVSQYFWPENFRINDLAVGLAERGHEVTVLTGQPNYPEGRFYPGYGFLKKRTESYQGIRVMRAPLVPRGRGGGFRLAVNYLSFALSASVLSAALKNHGFEAIFVYEPSPITVGLPALCLKKATGAPVVFWVQDLWPESLIATGAITSRRALALVGKLVSVIYRGCDLILVTSRAFIPSVRRFVSDHRPIRYFPQYGEDLFREVDLPADAPERTLVPKGFTIMFAGNIGAAQDFDTILSTAEILRENIDIHFVILGDGRMRRSVEEEVDRRGLKASVHLLGRHPLESMPRFFSLADAMLVTLRRDPIFALTIPAKIQSYLACGRPIIAALDGEGARVVQESGAGMTCQAESPQDLAEAILKMRNLSSGERQQMGRKGRSYYSRNFDRATLLDQLEAWMYELRGTAANTYCSAQEEKS